jgi:hypothetical protein
MEVLSYPAKSDSQPSGLENELEPRARSLKHLAIFHTSDIRERDDRVERYCRYDAACFDSQSLKSLSSLSVYLPKFSELPFLRKSLKEAIKSHALGIPP